MKQQHRNGALPHANNQRKHRTQGPEIGQGIRLGVRVFLLVLLQTTLLPRVRFFGAVPDILLAFVAVTAVTGKGAENERAAVISGISAGFLADAIGGVGFGVSALLYFLTAFFGSFLMRRPAVGIIPALIQFYTFLLPITLLRTVATLISAWVCAPGGFSFLHCLTGTLIPEYFGTLLFAVPIFFLFRVRDNA